LALPGIDIKVHLLTRIAQNSNEILAEFANQNTEDGGLILDLIHPCGYSDADGTFLLNSEKRQKSPKIYSFHELTTRNKGR
jgi:hypothetical protein